MTWLAYWKDPIDAKSYKYVFLAPSSGFKTEADLAKYEKARELKKHIERIRKDYQKLWKDADVRQRQMSTALYFIDVLALRAGHEKDEDEAETVGCCTLKVCASPRLCASGRDRSSQAAHAMPPPQPRQTSCFFRQAENVEMVEGNKIKFDFLGKDSIRYENTVDVAAEVWKNMKAFKKSDRFGKAKKPDDQLFDAMAAQVCALPIVLPDCSQIAPHVEGMCTDTYAELSYCKFCDAAPLLTGVHPLMRRGA